MAKKSKGENSISAPRGKPKSGRVWKNVKNKFSLNVKTRGLKTSLTQKQKLREELQRIKAISRAKIAEKNEQKELRKERRRENLKRREENQRKAEIVQVISNTSKLKKMRKKHLRNIEKRDTTVVSN